MDITARRIAEQARDAGRRLVQTVIESIPAMVFWKDRKGVYRAATRSLRARARDSPVDVLGVPMPSSTGRRRVWQDRAHRCADPRRARWSCATSCREIFLANEPHACWSAVPLRAADGAIAGLLGVVVDVSGHAEGAGGTRRGEQRWGAAAGGQRRRSGARDRLPHRTQRVSLPDRRAARLRAGALQWSDGSGIERAHPTTSRAPSATPSRSTPGGATPSSTSSAALQGRRLQVVPGARAGTRAPVRGRPQRFLATHTDIDARKQAELAAESSRQLLHAIIDAIPHSIFWKNDRGVYLGCNAAFARKTRFGTRRRVLGRRDVQIGWARSAWR
ncbi:MAG: PAS domain-containing protein [Steroidobacteraceae bacterium]